MKKVVKKNWKLEKKREADKENILSSIDTIEKKEDKKIQQIEKNIIIKVNEPNTFIVT